MVKLFGGLFLLITLWCCPQLTAQDYLVLDRYGTKRMRIPVGSEVTFKLKGDKRKYTRRLVQLTDSMVVMGNFDIYLKLDDFDSFYFYRPRWRTLRYGTLIPAAGFLIGAAVHPLVDNPQYDQGDSTWIGLGFIALGQTFRLLEWKRFKITKKSRIWVGGI